MLKMSSLVFFLFAFFYQFFWHSCELEVRRDCHSRDPSISGIANPPAGMRILRWERMYPHGNAISRTFSAGTLPKFCCQVIVTVLNVLKLEKMNFLV